VFTLHVDPQLATSSNSMICHACWKRHVDHSMGLQGRTRVVPPTDVNASVQSSSSPVNRMDLLAVASGLDGAATSDSVRGSRSLSSAVPDHPLPPHPNMPSATLSLLSSPQLSSPSQSSAAQEEFALPAPRLPRWRSALAELSSNQAAARDAPLPQVAISGKLVQRSHSLPVAHPLPSPSQGLSTTCNRYPIPSTPPPSSPRSPASPLSPISPRQVRILPSQRASPDLHSYTALSDRALQRRREIREQTERRKRATVEEAVNSSQRVSVERADLTALVHARPCKWFVQVDEREETVLTNAALEAKYDEEDDVMDDTDGQERGIAARLDDERRQREKVGDCEGQMHIEHVPHRVDDIFMYRGRCDTCGRRVQWDTTSLQEVVISGRKYNVALLRKVEACFRRGVTATRYAELGRSISTKTCSATTFRRYERAICDAYRTAWTNEQSRQWDRLAAGPGGLMLASDGGWNRRGRSSHLFAYVVLDVSSRPRVGLVDPVSALSTEPTAATNVNAPAGRGREKAPVMFLQTLQHDHVCRAYERNGQPVRQHVICGNTVVASRNMEGESYRMLMAKLENTLVKCGSPTEVPETLYDRLDVFVMDKDVPINADIEIRNAKRPLRPILVALDPGHMKKNFVGRLRSIFTTKKSYAGLEYRMGQFFIRLLKRSETETVHVEPEALRRMAMQDLMKQRLELMIYHYYGVCRADCPHHNLSKDALELLEELGKGLVEAAARINGEVEVVVQHAGSREVKEDADREMVRAATAEMVEEAAGDPTSRVGVLLGKLQRVHPAQAVEVKTDADLTADSDVTSGTEAGDTARQRKRQKPGKKAACAAAHAEASEGPADDVVVPDAPATAARKSGKKRGTDTGKAEAAKKVAFVFGGVQSIRRRRGPVGRQQMECDDAGGKDEVKVRESEQKGKATAPLAGKRKLKRDMTSTEKADEKMRKLLTPQLQAEVDRIRAEIIRRQTEPEAAAAALPDVPAVDAAVQKALTLWKKTIRLDDPEHPMLWQKVMVEVLRLATPEELRTFCHGYNTCLAESFHSSRAALADKRIHWRTTWEGRCELTALRNNLGGGYILPVMCALGLTASPEEVRAIEREEQQRQVAVKQRNSQAVRMRLMRREKTRKVNRVRRLVEGDGFAEVTRAITQKRVQGSKHLPYTLSQRFEDGDADDEED
jgi:hypothetical protein